MSLPFGYTLQGHHGQYDTPLLVISYHHQHHLLMAKRCATLAFTHSIAKASISTSFIMLTTCTIVSVPRMMGTLSAKLESLG